MASITATEARKSFFELLRGVCGKHEIYRINYKSGGAVLMSEAEFEGLQETLHLLSAEGFREGFDEGVREVDAGESRSFEDVFGEPQ